MHAMTVEATIDFIMITLSKAIFKVLKLNKNSSPNISIYIKVLLIAAPGTSRTGTSKTVIASSHNDAEAMDIAILEVFPRANNADIRIVEKPYIAKPMLIIDKGIAASKYFVPAKICTAKGDSTANPIQAGMRIKDTYRLETLRDLKTLFMPALA